MKKLLLGAGACALALAGVGAALGLNANNAIETKAITVTKFNAGDSVYVRFDNSVDYFKDGRKVFANYQDSLGGWHHQEITSSNLVTVLGNNTLYKVALDYEAVNFQLLRKNGSWEGGQDNYSASQSTSGGVHNLYAVTGWDNAASFQSAGIADITLNQLSGGTITFVDSGNAGNKILDNHGYGYSDWNYTMTATPESGYYFKNWQYYNTSTSSYVDFESNGTTNPITITNCEGDTRYQAIFRNTEGDADSFVSTYMHFDDYAAGVKGDGKCISENWYRDARDAYEQLHSSVVSLINGNVKYANTIARLEKWAIANGDTFVDGAFVDGSGAKGVYTIDNGSNGYMLPVAIGVVTLAAALGAFGLLLRKKAEK